MKSFNMYNCGSRRIAWNDDDDDVIYVLGLDSRKVWLIRLDKNRLEANLVKLSKVKVKSKLTHLSVLAQSRESNRRAVRQAKSRETKSKGERRKGSSGEDHSRSNINSMVARDASRAAGATTVLATPALARIALKAIK
ncbi:hypothetical protein Tco_0169951 [Tanacetum coccineum]